MKNLKKLLLLIFNVLAAEEFDNGFEKLVKKYDRFFELAWQLFRKSV